MPPLPLTPARAILIGGLAVGTLDILKPIVFAAFRGVPATRVLQSVASGALGRSAYQGGLPVAALGLGFHFFIAFTVFTVYYFASRLLPTLARHGYVWGPVYGIAVYFFMQYVVFPLSAIGSVQHPWPVLIDGILTHILCVGLPTGIVTWEAARRGGASARGVP